MPGVFWYSAPGFRIPADFTGRKMHLDLGLSVATGVVAATVCQETEERLCGHIKRIAPGLGSRRRCRAAQYRSKSASRMDGLDQLRSPLSARRFDRRYRGRAGPIS